MAAPGTRAQRLGHRTPCDELAAPR
jgi:hypothetical protein